MIGDVNIINITAFRLSKRSPMLHLMNMSRGVEEQEKRPADVW